MGTVSQALNYMRTSMQHHTSTRNRHKETGSIAYLLQHCNPLFKGACVSCLLCQGLNMPLTHLCKPLLTLLHAPDWIELHTAATTICV